MWEYSNQQARRFDIKTDNPAFNDLGPHTSQLVLVAAYQQAEAFLDGLRNELKSLGKNWPEREGRTSLLEYTLKNLRDGLASNRIKSERKDAICSSTTD
jgi:hypothetical protein